MATNPKALINKLPELTQLQYDFTRHYIRNGFNAYEAALKAGYDKLTCEKGAYLLPQHPVIKPLVEKAVAKAREAIVDRLAIGVEVRLQHLAEVMRRFIPLDGSKLNATDANVGLKAIAEINKMTGDYAPDKRLALTVDLTKDKLKEIKRMYEDY